MEKSIIIRVALIIGLLPTVGFSEPNEENVLTLFQVGKNGNYCLSLTKDTSGCVSGVDANNDPVNVLDVALAQNKKTRYVHFENLSDAPHDMKFSGENAEDLPAQGPGDSTAKKVISVEDLKTQKINCSYHGDQLGLGYRVPMMQAEVVDGGESGHKERPKQEGAALPNPGPEQKIQRTGLADVGKEVMAKGRPAEVEKLLTVRPDLASELVASRPLLAQELGLKGNLPKANPTLLAGGKKPAVGQDSFFGKKGGAPNAVASAKGTLGKSPSKNGKSGGGFSGGFQSDSGGSYLASSSSNEKRRARGIAANDDGYSESDGEDHDDVGYDTELVNSEYSNNGARQPSSLTGANQKLRVMRLQENASKNESPWSRWYVLFLGASVALGGREFFAYYRAKKEKKAKS